jgi:hypothetical protein
LEISVGDETLHIGKVGAALDDVIGLMVNRPVVVKTVKDKKGHYLFRDIEPQD